MNLLIGLIPAPYRMMAAAIAVAVLVCGTFAAGWVVNGWRWEAKAADQERDQRKAEFDAIAQRDVEREKLAEMGRIAVRDFASKEQKIRRLKDELDSKVSGATDGRVCFDSWSAVMLWNQAISGAERVPGDTGKPDGGPTGAGVTDAEVLRNHNDNGARWQQCRQQVKAIRELYNKQRGKEE